MQLTATVSQTVSRIACTTTETYVLIFSSNRRLLGFFIGVLDTRHLRHGVFHRQGIFAHLMCGVPTRLTRHPRPAAPAPLSPAPPHSTRPRQLSTLCTLASTLGRAVRRDVDPCDPLPLPDPSLAEDTQLSSPPSPLRPTSHTDASSHSPLSRLGRHPLYCSPIMADVGEPLSAKTTTHDEIAEPNYDPI